MLREIVKTKNKSDAVSELILMLLTLLISTFMLRFLWNRSLVKHINVLSPISNLSDAFLLSISLVILRGA
jgi:accessory gene regulator protein AgrB